MICIISKFRSVLEQVDSYLMQQICTFPVTKCVEMWKLNVIHVCRWIHVCICLCDSCLHMLDLVIQIPQIINLHYILIF